MSIGAMERNEAQTEENGKLQTQVNAMLKHKNENLSIFTPDPSILNQMKPDPKKIIQSTRIYIDDEGKHLPNHIAFKDNVRYT